jgi:uncharacterized membrane protein YuzA (DUF378 family)
MKKDCKKSCKRGCCGSGLAKTLVMIGGLNWGLAGIGMLVGNEKWNVVHLIFGNVGKLEAIIYLLVGLATLGMIIGCCCKKCKSHCCKKEDCKDGSCDTKTEGSKMCCDEVDKKCCSKDEMEEETEA